MKTELKDVHYFKIIAPERSEYKTRMQSEK